MRLVVTGEVDGVATVSTDTEVEPRRLDAFPGAEFFLLWGSRVVPPLPTDGAPPTDAWIPAVGGARFGISVLPPAYGSGRTLTASDVDEIERSLPGLAPVLELDHPGMHTTDTYDFIVVLRGRVTLELDEGREVALEEGDCVVQRGTRHAWRNEGDEPCALMIVMVGAPRG
jgi:mannose-6-phosphate isomerase-like protein (cupin superfamily)